jgi:hypothetical protein
MYGDMTYVDYSVEQEGLTQFSKHRLYRIYIPPYSIVHTDAVWIDNCKGDVMGALFTSLEVRLPRDHSWQVSVLARKMSTAVWVITLRGYAFPAIK